MLCVCDFCLDDFSERISADSRNCFFNPPKRCPFGESAPFCLEKVANSRTHV